MLSPKVMAPLALLASGVVVEAAASSSYTYTYGPAQSSSLSSAWASWYDTFASGTQVSHVTAELATVLPLAAYTSVLNDPEAFFFAVPTTTFDVFSFATNPPVKITSTPTWVASLPDKVKQDVLAMQTSFLEAEASVARKVLHLNAAPAPGLDGVGWALGVVAGVVGVVAAVL